MIFVVCHKLWRIKCPRNFLPPLWMLPFISLFLLHVTVRPSDALGLKARVNKKKGRFFFSPCSVGEVTRPSIIYVGGNSATLELCTLIFFIFFFAKNK